MTIVVILAVIFVVTLGFVVAFGAPYVPSKRGELRLALTKLYKLGRHDVLIDIGSGDGIVLREASKLGARAVGYEISPLLVWISRFMSRNDRNVEVKLANVWHVDFPEDTTVVYVFGESRDIGKVARKVQQQANRLNRELKLISYGFQLSDKQEQAKYGAHFLYVISPLQRQ